MTTILNNTLISYLAKAEEGKYCNEDNPKGQIGFLENFFRSIGSFLGACDSSSQKAFSFTIKALKKELKKLPKNAKPTQLFIQNLHSELNVSETRDKLRALARSEKAKSDLGKVVGIVNRLGREHFAEERAVQMNTHYQSMNIEGNTGLKLSAYPKKPVKSYPITQEAKDAFVNSATEEKYQLVIRKALDNIQHLTMDALEKNLEKCVDKLNDRLVEMGMPSYSVAVGEQKSSQWCAELATPYLYYAPQAGFSLDAGGCMGVGGTTSRLGDMDNLKEEALVLFEDASYRGEQLSTYLRKIIEGRANNSQKPLKIFIVIPFFSKKAEALIKGNVECFLREAKHVSVEIMTSETKITLLDDVFDPNERKLFADLSFGGNERGTGFTYADWRFPDGNSFPAYFGKTNPTDPNAVDYLAEQRSIPVPYKSKG